MQSIGDEPGDRLEALRLKGPPDETIKMEAEIDATDQLEFPGITRRSPSSGCSRRWPRWKRSCTRRAPSCWRTTFRRSWEPSRSPRSKAPLSLFVWSRNRIVPVRLTEFTVTEEAFDTSLNPIRARVSLGMRVLTVDDLGFAHRGGNVFLLYQQQKERFAGISVNASLGLLGINSIPGG